MTPRLAGVRERRDRPLYDTHTLVPGQDQWFFDSKETVDNMGDVHRTNMTQRGKLATDQSYGLLAYGLLALGIRCLGKPAAEEDLLLDHLHAQLMIGDRPQLSVLGPHASMLRHEISTRRLEELEALADEVSTPIDALISKYGTLIARAAAAGPGYVFNRPVVIPVRQNFAVRVTASKALPSEVCVRVTLFGLLIRDYV